MIIRASGRSEPANGGSFFEESAVENVIDIAAPAEKVFDTLERRFDDKAEGG